MRHYYCDVCKYKKETKANRGPVPSKCPDCKKAEPTKKLSQPGNAIVPVIKVDRRSIEAQVKVQRAVELRRDYKTWDYIARECGYSGPESACAAVKIEMKRRSEHLSETIDDFRERQLTRLEHIADTALKIMETEHLVVNSGKIVTDPRTGEWLRDNGPKLSAIDRLVKISESARKLVGADAPDKVEAAVTVQYTITGIPEEEMP